MTSPHVSTLIFSLLAIGGVACGPECAEEDMVQCYFDGDGDGFMDEAEPLEACECPEHYLDAETTLDCDPAHGDAYPDAEERCDGYDNDCDGETDEEATDAQAWYADEDGDGYGDLDAEAVVSCAPPSGHVADHSDCDDSTFEVNPGQQEWCDDLDNDCDDLVDEEDADLLDASVWYADADDDGYGDAAVTIDACDLPDEGYTDDDTDCDDEDAAINPAAEEICSDGIDNDCDAATVCTLAQRFAVDTYADAILWGAEGSLAGGAIAAVPLGDDGYASLLIGASKLSTDSATDVGGAYVLYDDVDLMGEIHLEEADVAALLSGDSSLSTGGAESRVGYSVDWATGFGSSGADYAFLGTLKENNNVADDVAAYLVQGPITANVDLANADYRILRPTNGVNDRHRVATGGDFDGSGTKDLVMTLVNQISGSGGSGYSLAEAYVFLNPSAGDIDPATADMAVIQHLTTSTQANMTPINAGDLDDDGYDDIVLGLPHYEVDGAQPGAVFVITDALIGGIGGTNYLIEDVGTMLTGSDGDYTGAALAAAGDIDGDGRDDFLVSSPGDYNGAPTASAPTGAVYLVSWWDKMDPDLHSTAEVRILGAAAGDQIGTSLASGDFDGDGINDVLIGAHTHDGQDGTTNVGAAYLIPGATLREYIGGDLDLETPPADVIVFEGSEQDEELGSSVVLADVDGDGLDDAVIGASMHDGNGTNSGAVFIVYGVGL